MKKLTHALISTLLFAFGAFVEYGVYHWLNGWNADEEGAAANLIAISIWFFGGIVLMVYSVLRPFKPNENEEE